MTEFWKPGSIVKLNEPWNGFTHGLIVEIIGHDEDGVADVSLHLYNAESGLLLIDKANNGIPTYVDFSVDELIPWKDVSVVGYVAKA